MTRHILTIFLSTILFACSDSPKQDSEVISIDSSATQTDSISKPDANNNSKPDGLKTKKTSSTPTIFSIKDSTQYSTDWLKAFKKRHSLYSTVSLIGDTIIINNDRKDVQIIPTDLPLNKQIIYEPSDKSCKLTVKRINYSTIEYEYHQGKNVATRQGRASIEPTFYYGAEGTFEDKDGMTYGMNEYIDSVAPDCSTTILIGVKNINQSQFFCSSKTNRDKIKSPPLLRRR